MKDFFIDTANIPYIENLWEKIKDRIDPKMVRGITTNPNAFFKLNKLKLSEWLELLPKLCELVNKIRGDENGVVYIQGPNSLMSNEEILEYVYDLSKRKYGSKIGLKIPPYNNVLSIVDDLNKMIDVNVTGVADAGTALKCMTYNVRYVSIIPGRMDEVGINAINHLLYAGYSGNKKCEIISGSMRTIDGLLLTFKANTVPTIGERVWDQLLVDNNLNDLIISPMNVCWDMNNRHEFTPTIDEKSFDLSKAFFEQMDKCGEVAYDEFKTRNV